MDKKTKIELQKICDENNIEYNKSHTKKVLVDKLQYIVLKIVPKVVSEYKTISNKFNLEKYFELLDNIIQNILERPNKEVLTYDILDTEKSKTNKLIVLKEKQRQMKVGEIWQEALGNYDGFINLKNGHESGLDIISHTKKIAIELKNRTNTDNASSKKSNLDKLAKFKKIYPDYICIYANINDDTEKKTLQGCDNKILHDGVEIQHQVGHIFLKYILGDDTNLVIDFIKKIIDKYTL